MRTRSSTTQKNGRMANYVWLGVYWDTRLQDLVLMHCDIHTGLATPTAFLYKRFHRGLDRSLYIELSIV